MSHGKLVGLGSTILFIGGCQSWQYDDIENMPPTAATPEISEPGYIEIRYFDNIAGVDIETLTSSTHYPDNPDEVVKATSLEIAGYRADNYGTLARGFIQPQQSGDYRFFVAGNDKVELWLSADSTAENAKIIASVPGYTNPLEFTKYASQTSANQFLEADKRYYFRVVHKEGTASDHFKVAWEGPGLSRQIIDGAYLHSWAKPSAGSGDDQTSQEAYHLGYRVGFLDGKEALAFNPSYPPADQDQDGLYDNWEIVNGLNPNDSTDANSDPDGDFLVAADEFLIGTYENNPDSDGDGIPDGVEFAAELDPLDHSDANQDLDNDGFSNLDEYLAGTELNNPESVPETPEPSVINGFVGQYYNGTSFDRFAKAQYDPQINFDWGKGRPIPELPEDQFSVRWSGEFTPPHDSGTRDYDFVTTTNDGVRLYLNGQVVIDDWNGAPTRDHSYRISTEAGEKISITMENFEGRGNAFARLTIVDSNTGSAVSATETITSYDLTSTSTQDSDADGIPDVWELKYGLSAYVNDAASVNNGSGVSNLEAYESSLDPFTLEPVSDGGDGSGSEPVTPTPEPSVGEITLSWTAPGTRVDGTSISLSEISHYLINYGQDSSKLDKTWPPVSSENTSETVTGLSAGTWYFTVTVVDVDGLKSAPSDVVSATVQ